MIKGDVRYRFVIDIASLKSQALKIEKLSPQRRARARAHSLCLRPEDPVSFAHALRPAEFDFGQRGKIAQQVDRLSIKLTWPVVQYAHGSDAVSSHEYWAAGIEPDPRYLSDKRVA